MIQSTTSHSKPKKENILLNIGFNIIVPYLLLTKGYDWCGSHLEDFLQISKDDTLVDSIILVIALSFPVSYGILDYIRRKKLNYISVLGFVSVLLTCGIGLIPGATVSMFAIKEAALPTILAIATIVTLKTKTPLVKLFLYNPQVIQVNLVDQALVERGTTDQFHHLLKKCTWFIALTFIMSACLNYILAIYVVKTEPFIDMRSFNQEVGTMMALSFPIISLPCMIVSAYTFWLLIKGIRQLAGLSLEEVLNQPNTK
jgi:hypothetical protein